MAITAQGLYSDRARSLFGMQAAAVATSTTSPVELFVKGQQDLINKLTAAGKDQVQLLKAQIKLLTDIKKSQSTFGVSDLLMTKILTKFTAGLFGGLSRVGTVVGAGIAGSGVAAVKLLSPMTKGITEGVARLGTFLKTGVLELVSGTTKFFGNMFSSISRTIASVGRPVANVVAALTTLKAGSMADFGGGILKSFGKVSGILGRIGSKFLIPLAAIFTAFDLFKGFNNADEILGRGNVGIIGRIGSAISSTVNSLLMGIPDWISDKLGFKNFAQMVDSGGISLGNYASKMADTMKEAISGTFDYVTSFASGITDYIKSLWESAKASSIGTFLGRVTGLFSTTSTNPTVTADPSLGLNKASPVAATNAVAINAIQQTNRVANTAIQTQQQGVEALEDSLDKSLKEQKNGIFASLTNFLGNAWDTTKKGAAVFGGMAADMVASTPDLVARGAGGSISGANETPFAAPEGVQSPSGRPSTGTPGTLEYTPGASSVADLANASVKQKLSIGQREYEGVDPRLRDIIQETTKTLPKGWRAEVISGSEPRSRGGRHPEGKAVDIQLYDDKGRKLDNYQLDEQGTGKDFRTYEMFAQNARKIQMEKYPDLNKSFKWGGYFWNGGIGNYGAADSMHFDIGGGPTGAGNWDQGLTRGRGSFDRGGPSSQGVSDWSKFKFNTFGADAPGTGTGVAGAARPTFGTNTSGASANDPVMASVLASARAKSFAEMDADPQLKATVLGLLSKENANHPEGPLEALVNRTAARGMSVRQAVYGGFYGPINRGQVSPLTGEAAKKYEKAYERVRFGSNDIGLRTDQGMVNEHRWADSVAGQGRGRKAQINGEWYSDMGPFAENWSKGILGKVDAIRQEQAKVAEKAYAQGAVGVLGGLGSASVGTKGTSALNSLYKEQGSAIGKSIVETVNSQPQQPTFTPAPISSPLTPAQPPVPGSINAQNPKGAPSDPVSTQPSTKDISSIDEYSMLMINSSVMA